MFSPCFPRLFVLFIPQASLMEVEEPAALEAARRYQAVELQVRGLMAIEKPGKWMVNGWLTYKHSYGFGKIHHFSWETHCHWAIFNGYLDNF